MSIFTQNIIKWYSVNKRDLPWRQSKDAYQVWLSEIILQQTRVEQGLPYYHKILNTFPNVKDLAHAPENRLMELWQGLGYYSRARNMQKCAKIISTQFDGVFPETFKELIKLPGIGPYTAAAVASIAFDEPVAVVDGNVNRLVARYLGVTDAVNEKKGEEAIYAFVNEEVPERDASSFNQAMMEMGALICTPKKPKCDTCVLNQECYARKNKLQSVLPVKVKRVKVKSLAMNYFVLDDSKDSVFILKRPNQGIWQGLHEFPSLEFFKPSKEDELLEVFKHTLTHKKIEAKLWKVNEFPEEIIENNTIFEVDINDIGNKFPIHKLMHKIFIKWQDQ